MDIVTRQEAQDAGLRFYFTGKTCKHGHVVERYVVGGNCIKCGQQVAEKWRKDNANRVKFISKKYSEDNAERIKLYSKTYREKNPERIKLAQNKYREANCEKTKLAVTKWAYDDPEKIRTNNEKRRALKRNALDKTISDDKFIQIEKRKNDIITSTGITHHTDHFIQLSKGGMHTPSNLRIIPAVINLRKNANIWTEQQLKDACSIFYVEQGIYTENINKLMKNYRCF